MSGDPIDMTLLRASIHSLPLIKIMASASAVAAAARGRGFGTGFNGGFPWARAVEIVKNP